MGEVIHYRAGPKVPGEMKLLNRRLETQLSEAQGFMEKKLLKHISNPDCKVYMIDLEKISGQDRSSFVLGVIRTEDLSYKFIKGTVAEDGTKFKFEQDYSSWESLSRRAQEEFREIYEALSPREGEGEHGPK